MNCQICGDAGKFTTEGVPGQRITLCPNCQHTVSALRVNSSAEAESGWEKYNAAHRDLSLQEKRAATPEGAAFIRWLFQRYPLKEKIARDALLRQRVENDNEARRCQEEMAAYEETSRVDDYISLNEYRSLWCIPQKGIYCRPRPFSDILDYEVVENGTAVQSGTAGAAAVGGLLFGVVGAVVGSSMAATNVEMISSLFIRVVLNNPDARWRPSILWVPIPCRFQKTARRIKPACNAAGESPLRCASFSPGRRSPHRRSAASPFPWRTNC